MTKIKFSTIFGALISLGFIYNARKIIDYPSMFFEGYLDMVFLVLLLTGLYGMASLFIVIRSSLVPSSIWPRISAVLSVVVVSVFVLRIFTDELNLYANIVNASVISLVALLMLFVIKSINNTKACLKVQR